MAAEIEWKETIYPGFEMAIVRHPKPQDNPAHRVKHGLDGAYDPSCQDDCCAIPPYEELRRFGAPRCSTCGAHGCPSLTFLPDLGGFPSCPAYPA